MLGFPEFRVRVQGTLNDTAFLVYILQAATTEDCIATYSSLTDRDPLQIFSASRLMPVIIIFIFPKSTCMPFFSISVFHVSAPCWTHHIPLLCFSIHCTWSWTEHASHLSILNLRIAHQGNMTKCILQVIHRRPLRVAWNSFGQSLNKFSGVE